MKRTNRIKQAIAGVFLLLFSFYYANVCFFSHSHIIGGVTIVHSHLHGSHHSSNDSGQHSDSQLTLIAHLSQLMLLEHNIDSPSLTPAFTTIHQESHDCSSPIAFGEHLHPSLRGPPTYIL